jgi:hypothetical protein
VAYTHSGAVAAVAGGELSLYSKHTNVQRFTTAEEDTDPSAVQLKLLISNCSCRSIFLVQSLVGTMQQLLLLSLSEALWMYKVLKAIRLLA